MSPRAPQRSGGGAGLPPCGGAGKPLPLRRVPGVGCGGVLKASLGILCAATATWFLLPLASTSLTLFPETSEVAEEWEGRRLDMEKAWEPELGGWRSPARKGGISARRKGPLGPGGLVWGRLWLWGEARVLSLPSGVWGPLLRGTFTQQLPTSRTKGLRSTARVGERRWREAGRQAVGAGRAPPHISSRGRRRAPSSRRLSEAASKSRRARVPYLTAPLAPFLPYRPHPLPGSPT